MGIKLGNLDISSFKVGGADCSIYLGDTKLYPEEEPIPTPEWISLKKGDTIPKGYVFGVESITSNDLQSNDLIIGDANSDHALFTSVATRAPSSYGYFYTVSNGVSTYQFSWTDTSPKFIFSDYSGAREYYYEDGTKTMPLNCQLYIAQV